MSFAAWSAAYPCGLVAPLDGVTVRARMLWSTLQQGPKAGRLVVACDVCGAAPQGSLVGRDTFLVSPAGDGLGLRKAVPKGRRPVRKERPRPKESWANAGEMMPWGEWDRSGECVGLGCRRGKEAQVAWHRCGAGRGAAPFSFPSRRLPNANFHTEPGAPEDSGPAVARTPARASPGSPLGGAND